MKIYWYIADELEIGVVFGSIFELIWAREEESTRNRLAEKQPLRIRFRE